MLPTEARFRVLELALLERMARDPERHPAVRFALREFLHVYVPDTDAVFHRARPGRRDSALRASAR